jgi:pSer/pThr/pTyr-binding forkhead associated (FHA) protein
MIRIADLTVSRRHAQIQADGGKYYISDMGSLNDTLLNGERIRGQQELFDGARLTIGMHTLVFSYR